MAGLTSIPARRAFAESLLEQLHDTEAEAVKTHQCLDSEGVLECGAYAAGTGLFSFHVETSSPAVHLHLPQDKIRLVNSTRLPHEVLDLISTIGIDVFDAGWPRRAAGWLWCLILGFLCAGIRGRPKIWEHNLNLARYTHDLSAFGDIFCGAAQAREGDERDVCPCGASSPMMPSKGEFIVYDTIDLDSPRNVGCSLTSASSGSNVSGPADPEVHHQQPFTRAYIHHLLHTHEISAHALLVMHNLAVVEAFFERMKWWRK